MPLLTFVIPIRHPENAKDWTSLKTRLKQTIQSIAAQTNKDWSAIIVANKGSDLPPLPDKFSVTWVNFPPNKLHDVGFANREQRLDAFRYDKGRRVLAGLYSAVDSTFTMITDDDDLISNKIVEFVSKNQSANGWEIKQGWVWDDGGHYLLQHNDFSQKCGTCLIIRRDLYSITDRTRYDQELIKDNFGSHHRIGPKLATKGTPLKPLPFRGAVYRIGNSSSHSGTPGIFRDTFLKKGNLKRPHHFLINLTRLKRIKAKHRYEFFGQDF